MVAFLQQDYDLYFGSRLPTLSIRKSLPRTGLWGWKTWLHGALHGAEVALSRRFCHVGQLSE